MVLMLETLRVYCLETQWDSGHRVISRVAATAVTDATWSGLTWLVVQVMVVGWMFGNVGCHTTSKGAELSCELDYAISFWPWMLSWKSPYFVEKSTFHWYYPHFMEIFTFCEYYLHFVDIYVFHGYYPHFVEISMFCGYYPRLVVISTPRVYYPHFVDIICISYILSTFVTSRAN